MVCIVWLGGLSENHAKISKKTIVAKAWQAAMA